MYLYYKGLFVILADSKLRRSKFCDLGSAA